MKKKFQFNTAMQEGVFFLLVSGWLVYYSLDAYNKSFNKDWAQSPSLFPLAVALMLGLLAVLLLTEGVRKAPEETQKGKGQTVQVLVLLGMIALYYAALCYVKLPYIGVTVAGMTLSLSTFELATAVFLLGMMLYLGVRGKAVLCAVPIGATAFLSIMFRTLLRVLLP